MALGGGIPGAKRRKLSDLQMEVGVCGGKENGGPWVLFSAETK